MNLDYFNGYTNSQNILLKMLQNHNHNYSGMYMMIKLMDLLWTKCDIVSPCFLEKGSSKFLLPSRFDGLKKTLGFSSNDRIKFDSKQLYQRHNFDSYLTPL